MILEAREMSGFRRKATVSPSYDSGYLESVPADWAPSHTKYRCVYSGDRVIRIDPGSRTKSTDALTDEGAAAGLHDAFRDTAAPFNQWSVRRLLQIDTFLCWPWLTGMGLDVDNGRRTAPIRQAWFRRAPAPAPG